MQNRKMQLAMAALFCAFIAAFALAYVFLPKQSFSENEKRVLAGFPEFSAADVLDGSFEAGIEDWMSDHVPGRDLLVGLNAQYEQLSGRNGLNGVIRVGKDRLYAAAEEMDAADVLRKCERIRSFAEKTGLPTDVMLIPTAGYIYEDALPMHAAYPDGALAELVGENLDGAARLIWPEERFRSLEGAQLYYNTDHHLTSRGAYEACRMYVQVLGMDAPAPEDYDVEVFDGFYGSMYSKSGLWNTPPDTIEIWRSRALGDVTVRFDDREPADSLFFPEHLQEMDKYPVFLDGNHGLTVIETENEGENLLMIRDSFGHCFGTFAADSFHSVTLVDLRYCRKPLEELIAEMEIDRVLVLYGVDTFLTDSNFAWLR